MIYELPFPPTVNHYYATVPGPKSPDGHRRSMLVITADGRHWQKRVRAAIGAATPVDGRVKVRIWLWFPRAGKLDLDNRVKPLLDVLTKCGVWGDDSQVEELRVSRRGIVRPNGRCLVSVVAMDRRLF